MISKRGRLVSLRGMEIGQHVAFLPPLSRMTLSERKRDDGENPVGAVVIETSMRAERT